MNDLQENNKLYTQKLEIIPYVEENKAPLDHSPQITSEGKKDEISRFIYQSSIDHYSCSSKNKTILLVKTVEIEENKD